MPMQRLTSMASAERHVESDEDAYHAPSTEEAELRSALDDLEAAAASAPKTSPPTLTVRPRLPR